MILANQDMNQKNDLQMGVDEIILDYIHLMIFPCKHLVHEGILQFLHLLFLLFVDKMYYLEFDELDKIFLMLLDLKHRMLHQNDNHVVPNPKRKNFD
jgi:hypothetical protein